ncbi:MAG: 50S ribosomal protein L6 [Bacteroidota bacterium]
MSRIGKQPIKLPAGTSCTFNQGSGVVIVKGSKGELKQAIKAGFGVAVQDGEIVVSRPTDEKPDRALHGLYRALIANMVEGVTNGYKRQMELIGVGYKASAQGNILELSLGYSHNVFLAVPSELKLQAVQEKGSNPMIILEGIDKQLIGQVASKIKSLRKVEPYKGKGIRYVGEFVRRKAGKAAAK